MHSGGVGSGSDSGGRLPLPWQELMQSLSVDLSNLHAGRASLSLSLVTIRRYIEEGSKISRDLTVRYAN